MNTRAPHAFPALLLGACLTPSLLAQSQLAESVRGYLPNVRDNSRSVRAADFDQDGDLDLLVGNSQIITSAQNRLLLNDGRGTFTEVTATHLPVGLWYTVGLAVGDVDKDGDLDFVTGDSYQNRLFLNDGSARFTDATFGRLPPQASETRRLLLVDVDGDLDLDLVAANYRQEMLCLNDGSGRFTDVTATHLPADTESTWDLAAGDVDKDGDLDLLLANYGQGRLYLNDGSGKFTDATAARLPGLQANSASVSLADIDKDGDLDLFVGFWTTPGQLYVNDGTGTFTDGTASRLPPTKVWHWEAVFGDVDGDQDADLVYTTIHEDMLFLNDGTGKFTDTSAARLPGAVSSTIDVILADLDGDQDLDLATADTGQQNRLFFNDGRGYFANATPQRLEVMWIGARALALGDLDGDQDRDLVMAAGDYGEAVEDDMLLRNDGRGNLVAAPPGDWPTIKDDSVAVVLGDVDRDGDLDVLLGNLRQQSRLFLNNGLAKLTDVTATHLPAASHATTSLAFGDVDKDGDLDLVHGVLGAPSRLWLNDGTGRFTDVTAARMPAVSRETRAVAMGDVDRDGDLDLVLGNGLAQGEMESLYVNDGTGKFADETAARMPSVYAFATASLALGDVDGDGDLDLAVGNDGIGLGRFNRLYRNDGAGRFTDGDLVYDYFRTLAIAFGDVDGDGDLDAFCGDHDHVDKLYLNDGKGGFSDVTWPRMPGQRDRTLALAVGDVDGDGDLDLVRSSDWEHATLLVNHHRQVASPRLAKIGTVWPLEVYAKPGYSTTAQLAVPMVAAGAAAIPLAPWGKLGLDPATMLSLPPLVLPAPTGKATLALPIPNLVDLVGKSMYWQALVLHTASLSEARFSNVLAERFVR